MILVAWSRHDITVLPPLEHRRDIQKLGVFQFLNAIFFLHGVSLAGGFVASVTQLTIPVLVLVYAALTRIEEPSLRRMGAMLVVVGGCALTACGHTVHAVMDAAQLSELADQAAAVHPEDPRRSSSVAATSSGRALLSHHQHRTRHRTAHVQTVAAGAAAPTHDAWLPPLGVALLLAQCVSFVGIVVIQKRVLRTCPVSLVVLWSYLLATGYTAAYSLCTGTLWHLPAQLSSAADVASVAFAAVVGSVVYFEAVALATKHLPPTLVACSVALEPLAVSSLGAALFGRTPSPLEVAGYVVASVGACAMALFERDEPERPGIHFARRSESGVALHEFGVTVLNGPRDRDSRTSGGAPLSPRGGTR